MDDLKELFSVWIPRLGLGWWDINIRYYDDPEEVLQRFGSTDAADHLVAARTYTHWMYGKATIDVNLHAMRELTRDELKTIVVHELCHILVNEMREGELHHEERVVTGLTKAFLWAVESALNDNRDRKGES